MQFRIADSFTDSLAKLDAQEQKAVKTTAFDLQMNPASPGMQFHRVDKSKDENFWSIRVNRDIRLIVHKADASMLLAFVGHHDDAYAWAERRRIETHPRTGAAQLVRLLAAPDLEQPWRTPAQPLEKPLFAGIEDDELLSYGVPEDWLEATKAATEDSLFDLAEHLPQEAAEALLDLATGKTPTPPLSPEQVTEVAAATDPFEHPDAQRRFRLLTDATELQQALDYPWEKWTVFLHPAQRAYVDRVYTGPTRISGSAGTGKTVVALHRAAYLARTEHDAKILLTTFSKPLANALAIKLDRLIGNRREAYRDVPRLGRKIRLGAKQRETLWAIFEHLRASSSSARRTQGDHLAGSLPKAW